MRAGTSSGQPSPQKHFCVSERLASWLLAPPCPPACIHQDGTPGSPPPAACCWLWRGEGSGFALPVRQQDPAFVPAVTVSCSCSLTQHSPSCAAAASVVSEGPGAGSERCSRAAFAGGALLPCPACPWGRGSTEPWAVSLALKYRCSFPWLLLTLVLFPSRCPTSGDAAWDVPRGVIRPKGSAGSKHLSEVPLMLPAVRCMAGAEGTCSVPLAVPQLPSVH